MEAEIMRKGLLLLAVCLAAAAALRVPARAEEGSAPAAQAEIQAEGVCGKNGDNLTWTLYKDGTLVIGGQGEMEDYMGFWFLESTTPDPLPIPSVGTEFAPWFYRVDNIWGVCEGEPVRLKKVVLQEGVTSIGTYAFSSCMIDGPVSIPGSVRSIGDGAFMGATFEEIGIPEGVARIGAGAFMMSSLLEAHIPSTVTSIGDGAFSCCGRYDEETGTYRELDAVTVHSDNQSYRVEDGVLYNWDMTELLFYLPGREGAHFDIPSGVKVIGGSAFYGSKLVSVGFPEGLEEIGWNAFLENQLLETVRLPDSVRKMGYCAFADCHSLTDLTLSAGLSEISHGAFQSCGKLQSVAIPASVTQIGGCAFDFTDLRTVYIPKSVTSIDFAAFDCTLLKNVYYEGSEADWSRVSLHEWGVFDDFYPVTFHYNSRRMGIPAAVKSAAPGRSSVQYDGPDLPSGAVVLAASVNGGRVLNTAAGTRIGSKGQYDFDIRLKQGDKLFFLEPGTLAPLSGSAVLTA